MTGMCGRWCATGCVILGLAFLVGCSKEPEPLDWRTTLENTVVLPDGSEIKILTSEPQRLDMQLGQLLQGVTGRVKVSKQIPGMGTLISEFDMVNGVKDGEELIHGETPFGERRLLCRLQNKGGKRDGEYIGYFSDQKVQCKIHFQEDAKHGTEELFFPNGKPFLVANYDKDRPEGPFKIFTADGGSFADGVCHEGKPQDGTLVDDPNTFIQTVVSRPGERIKVPVSRYENGEKTETTELEYMIPGAPATPPVGMPVPTTSDPETETAPVPKE